ncbi:MAG: MGMT family protein [Lentisphaeraceae bacterium]|nr:MGMT family protein [Lentisphaeraceae bacterium]
MKEYSLYEHFYDLISQIPKGKVSTYGDIAKMADCRSARAVGFALNQLPEGSDIPWQRVINSQGKVSTRTNSEGHCLQQQLLEEEGIQFIDDKVNLSKYRWQPQP